MTSDSRHFKKLLKAQMLIKARDQSDLEETRGQLVQIQEENNYLFSLLSKGSASDFLNPDMIAKRFERNSKNEAVLNARLTSQQQALLQASRRCDAIDEKRKLALDMEERKEVSNMLEEYVATKILRDSSLA